MSCFELSLKAKEDLRDIAIFTQHRWGKEQRNIYIRQFDKSFKLLADNPSIGKKCDEIIQGYLKFPHGSHIIFYVKTGEKQIRINRLLHYLTLIFFILARLSERSE